MMMLFIDAPQPDPAVPRGTANTSPLPNPWGGGTTGGGTTGGGTSGGGTGGSTANQRLNTKKHYVHDRLNLIWHHNYIYTHKVQHAVVV